MIKKILLTLFLIVLLIPVSSVFAQEKTSDINVYFFWGEGCPHCAKEKPFLDKLENKYPQVNINSYEVWGSRDNQKLLIDFGEKLNANISGVPFTVVGEKYFIGWYNEQSTGKEIEDAIKYAELNSSRDIGFELSILQEEKNNEIIPEEQLETVISENVNNPIEGEKKDDYKDEKSPIPQKLKVPLLGEIETKNFSLPVLTVVLGLLDGFNPCAMWTLLFLISLLLGMENRKRMWTLGTAFIVASASVYFLFMAAWLNLILFIGVVIWVRIIIGIIALLGGGYNLKEYFTSPDAGCKVTGGEKRQKVFEKLKNITHQKNFYLALGGIIVLAFAVNLVELICSAGLPAVYTQVLALSNLTKWQYYLYILLYLFFFMLDDLIIFFIAMTTLRMTGITTKYSRWSHLIGGVLMVIIGLMLIFKPEWLMFG